MENKRGFFDCAVFGVIITVFATMLAGCVALQEHNKTFNDRVAFANATIRLSNKSVVSAYQSGYITAGQAADYIDKLIETKDSLTIVNNLYQTGGLADKKSQAAALDVLIVSLERLQISLQKEESRSIELGIGLSEEN